jgi:LysM repeat protein
MGNFEKLSVLVIVVIIVMILVVALYTWQDNGDASTELNQEASDSSVVIPEPEPWPQPPVPEPLPDPDPIPDPLPGPLPDPDPLPSPGPLPSPVPDNGDGPAEDLSITAPWSYQIKSGDTLSQISQRELGTVKRQGEIKALNADVDWMRIRPGQLIKMPARGKKIEGVTPGPNAGTTPGRTLEGGPSAGGTIKPGEYYVTKPGDTVQSVARDAYESVERWPELWARNLSAIPSIETPIKPGTRIFIPK